MGLFITYMGTNKGFLVLSDEKCGQRQTFGIFHISGYLLQVIYFEGAGFLQLRDVVCDKVMQTVSQCVVTMTTVKAVLVLEPKLR